MQKLKSKSVSNEFADILAIIENSRERAYSAVNKVLIEMYFQIGKYISEKVQRGIWGAGIVNEISEYIQKIYLNVKGFSSQNLWRMKQFYETYFKNEFLSTLSRELAWSINTRIMGLKSNEEREFYLRLAIHNKYSYRELDRQIKSGLYERSLISNSSELNMALTNKYQGLNHLRDNYILEFLNLPDSYKEKDLRKAILSHIKEFILELGNQFILISEEYRIRIGENEYFIDLLLFNRELSCLVAVELKTEKFKPEHLGKMIFYLEALNRTIKKESENPSVGLILCSSKDEIVVEYALSENLPPALVATYELKLPDKKLLQNKLKTIINNK